MLLSGLLNLGLASGLVQHKSLQTVALAELERIRRVRRTIQEGGAQGEATRGAT